MGRAQEAKEAYEQALALTSTGSERRYLARRLEEVSRT
jgi:predicted RNA polymerase sigma factor